jgi:hypothetical protein
VELQLLAYKNIFVTLKYTYITFTCGWCFFYVYLLLEMCLKQHHHLHLLVLKHILQQFHVKHFYKFIIL